MIKFFHDTFLKSSFRAKRRPGHEVKRQHYPEIILPELFE